MGQETGQQVPPTRPQGTDFAKGCDPESSRQYEQSQGATEEAETLLNQLDMIHKKIGHSNLSLMSYQSYELASRMQLAASEALDLDRESLKPMRCTGLGNQSPIPWPAVFTCPAAC